MTAIPYFHVDAFADAPFTGNPAAVLLLETWPDEGALRRIAAEINLPATAFAVPAADDVDHEIRWFSPRGEIGLCGHGTLAAAHALIGDRSSIRFRTRKAGLVSVVGDGGGGYALSLPVIPTEAAPLPEIGALLGIDPVETYWNPRGYALARYASEDIVRALMPDLAALKRVGDVQLIATAAGETTDIVSRVFSAGGGEDAATGSAHAVLTPYWAERLGRPAFTAFQASARGGYLSCRLDGERAVLGGRCVTIAEGRFLL